MPWLTALALAAALQQAPAETPPLPPLAPSLQNAMMLATVNWDLIVRHQHDPRLDCDAAAALLTEAGHGWIAESVRNLRPLGFSKPEVVEGMIADRRVTLLLGPLVEFIIDVPAVPDGATRARMALERSGYDALKRLCGEIYPVDREGLCGVIVAYGTDSGDRRSVYRITGESIAIATDVETARRFAAGEIGETALFAAAHVWLKERGPNAIRKLDQLR